MRQLNLLICFLFGTFWVTAQQKSTIVLKQALTSIEQLHDIQRISGEFPTLTTENDPTLIYAPLLERVGCAQCKLKLEHSGRSVMGRHFQLIQTIHDIPVYGAYLRVSVNPEGKMILLSDHLIPIPAGVPVKSGLRKPDYYLFNGMQLEPLFREQLKIRDLSGNTVKEIEDRFYLHTDDTLVSGKVFNHDPLTRSGHIYGEGGTWQHFNDSDYALLNDMRETVYFPATFENDSFRLKSTYAVIEDFGLPSNHIAVSKTPVFDYLRSKDEFKDVMAYYHVLHTRDYFMSLGFTDHMKYQQRIDSHSGYDDNSYFSPTDTTLNFGVGCIPDAEDGDVPCHEYTHAMSFDINPTPVMNSDRRAVEEGMCDVTAAIMSYKTTTFNWRYLYNFDGPKPVATGVNGCWGGRNGQSEKTYMNRTGSPYSDCEIWSSCLLDIAEHPTVGHDTLMIIMLNSIQFMTQSSTMEQCAYAMLTADSIVYNGRHKLTMGYYFNQRKIGTFPESLPSIYALPSWMLLRNSYGFANGEGQLILESAGHAAFTADLYDVNGQRVRQGRSEGSPILFSPEGIPSGLYLLLIEQGGQQYTQRVVRF